MVHLKLFDRASARRTREGSRRKWRSSSDRHVKNPCRHAALTSECPRMRVDLYVESVLAKCEALKNNGLWAPEPRLRPAAWLANFIDDQERLIAAILLDNFIFYSDRSSDRLLAAAFNRFEDDVLLGRLASNCDSQSFMRDLVFTPVEGQDPGPTDSGKTLCRKLRDLIELPESAFFDPDKALRQVRATGCPLVFVDDFLGSGEQLIDTWERPYLGTPPQSFKEAYAVRAFDVFCLASVATNTAITNIRAAAAGIKIVATHVLDDTYSVRALAAPQVEPPISDFQSALRAFLAHYGSQLYLDAFLMVDDRPLFGFHELGLLFAFEHGVPDGTVPLLWAKGPGSWIRLVKYQ